MTDVVSREAFAAYFACVEKDGNMSVFHICSSLKAAEDWVAREKQQSVGNDNDQSLPPSPQVALPQKDAPISCFNDIIGNYLNSMKSFYDVVSLSSVMGTMLPGVIAGMEFNNFRKENLQRISEEDNVILYGVPRQWISSVNAKVRRFEHSKDGLSSLPANALMGLVARYDANVSSLVRFLLVARKEKLASGDKSIPVKEILAASSFEDLISDLVDDEIHSLLRGSHEDQIKYIEDNFSIKVRDGFERWSEFIEVFERRNLVAHGEGFANARYVKVCAKTKRVSVNTLKLGDPVILRNSYLNGSIDVVLEFGILLIWWLWLKQVPEELEVAYNAINSLTYDLICEKRYRLASRILNSVLSRISVKAPEVSRRMMAVNLANCHKKLNEDKEYDAALELFDWSASADEFKISVASLKGDTQQVCNLMERVTNEDVVGKSGFRDWPVFDWVRDNDDVCQRFEEVFGEPLKTTKPSKPLEGP